MNWRTMMSILLLLCSAFTVSVGYGQQQLDTDEVKAAVDEFYKALTALDSNRMEKVWAHEDYVTLINPKDKATIDPLLSTRVKSVVENAMAAAKAYMDLNSEMIRGDIMAMAFDVARAKPLFDQDRDRFRQFFTSQASLRGLPAAMLIDNELNILERADAKSNGAFALPPREALEKITDTNPQIALIADGNYFAAVLKVRGYNDFYLYVARKLDPQVATQWADTRLSASEYQAIEERQITVYVAKTVGWEAVQKDWGTVFGFWSALKVSSSDVQVRANQGMASATSVARADGTTKNGQKLSFDMLVTQVFEKRGDRWLLVSHHVSRANF